MKGERQVICCLTLLYVFLKIVKESENAWSLTNVSLSDSTS